MARNQNKTTIVQTRSGTEMARADIPISGYQSGVVDVTLFGARNFVFVLTNGWTDADLGFLVSYDGVIFSPLYNADGTRVLAILIGTVGVAVSRALTIPATYALGNAQSIVLESLNTSTGAALNQAAARAIQIAPLY